MAAARPTIDAFLGALRQLGTALGFLSERDDATVAGAKFDAFGATGARVGSALATVFEFLIQVMTAVVRIAEGVAAGWHWVSEGAGLVSNALSQLGTQFGDSMAYLTGSTAATQQTGSAWSSLGQIISFVIGVIVAAIGVFVSVLSAAVSVISAAIQLVIGVFSGLADVITGTVFVIGGLINGNWTDIWNGMKLVVFGVVDAILGTVLELGGAIAGVVDAMAGLFGGNTKLQAGVRGFKDYMHGQMASDFGVENLTFTPARPTSSPVPQSSGSPPALGAMPAVASVWAASNQTPAAPPPAPAAQQSPVVVQLQVDGQTLATAVHRADKDAAARSFSPVPSY